MSQVLLTRRERHLNWLWIETPNIDDKFGQDYIV